MRRDKIAIKLNQFATGDGCDMDAKCNFCRPSNHGEESLKNRLLDCQRLPVSSRPGFPVRVVGPVCGQGTLAENAAFAFRYAQFRYEDWDRKQCLEHQTTSSVMSSTPGKYFQPALMRTFSPGLKPVANTGTAAVP